MGMCFISGSCEDTENFLWHEETISKDEFYYGSSCTVPFIINVVKKIIEEYELDVVFKPGVCIVENVSKADALRISSCLEVYLKLNKSELKKEKLFVGMVDVFDLPCKTITEAPEEYVDKYIILSGFISFLNKCEGFWAD